MSHESSKSSLEAALSYARRGWAVADGTSQTRGVPPRSGRRLRAARSVAREVPPLDILRPGVELVRRFERTHAGLAGLRRVAAVDLCRCAAGAPAPRRRQVRARVHRSSHERTRVGGDAISRLRSPGCVLSAAVRFQHHRTSGSHGADLSATGCASCDRRALNRHG